jgi:1,4-dihydroxy-6-naphthoate synthase
MTTASTLRVAYTPDSDDVFNYYAWEHGHVSLPPSDPPVVFERGHIIELNHAARAGRCDVVGISSVIYPQVADDYWILAVGNSVGRGWGPVLASRRFESAGELEGRRVGVGGHPTTGSVLAGLYCPGLELVEMKYDEIADAVAADELAAGVMIHEELLHFPEKGLRPVLDLGRAWTEDTGLPLPVGLNLVRRSLGPDLAGRIAVTARASLQWGLDHPEETFDFARRFGRGCAEQHVAMFSNEDTLCLPADVREAMQLLFARVAAAGISPRLDSFRVIEAA